MSRLTCALSGVTYVVNPDTSGRATPTIVWAVAEAMSGYLAPAQPSIWNTTVWPKVVPSIWYA